MDRLDLVMQAFEYEKRDNCLSTHQEFFDVIDGKFNHPFVIDIYNRIKSQRQEAIDQQSSEKAKNDVDGENVSSWFICPQKPNK